MMIPRYPEKYMVRISTICLALCVFFLNACSAHEIPANWEVDCVGTMQIGFPEQADIATVTLRSLAEPRGGSTTIGFYFSDGQRAPYSYISYFGPINITGALTLEERRVIQAKVENEKKIMNKNASLGNAGKNVKQFSQLPILPQKGVGWRLASSEHLRIFLGDQYFSWDVNVDPENISNADHTFHSIVSGLTRRENFQIPNSKGICMPFSFIRDDGPNKRSVATTYRLRSHPDVTVMLEDASAVAVADFQNPEKFSAISKSNFFWTQDYQSVKSRESLLHGSHNDIMFANQKGVETKFKLIRQDDTEDYGYLVVTRGDPKAKEDTPDLMMYVIRDAKNAKSKGIAPMSKEAFFAMAKTIAASVKRRQTEPHGSIP